MVLAAAMIMSTVASVYADTDKTTTPVSTFSDIGSDSWYHDAVYWAADKGITAGTSKTEFGPMKSCTRGQIVTFLWRYAGAPKTSLAGNPFKDVNNQYYAEAVMWAKNKNITVGTSATTFDGEQTIDRKQAITFLWRLEGSREPSKESGFSDIPSGKYYSKAVAWGVENHITNGIGENKFGPDNPCTRAQIVKFIFNTDSNVKNEDPDKPGTSNTGKSAIGNISEDIGNTDNGGTSNSSNTTAHEHDWVAIKKKVHHDAAGHYEKVHIGTKMVVDEEAYDEQIDTGKSQYVCNNCDFASTDGQAILDHTIDEGCGYHTEHIYQIIHHEAVTHEEPVYILKWIQDKAAYDETVITGYQCSECGTTK